tara:strand:+ start:420 stop:563 length:144 start_codon:yes stop_codon:yes gene_type:complete
LAKKSGKATLNSGGWAALPISLAGSLAAAWEFYTYDKQAGGYSQTPV